MQAQVDEWIGGFAAGYWPPLVLLARLTEEVGELAREVNHRFGAKPKKPDEPPGDLALELADILFILLCYANVLHLDLETAFLRVMQKYRSRDRDRFPKPGGLPGGK